MMKKKMNNKGFTLMELIIVVAILAILIALIAPNLVGFIDSASQTALDGNAKSCYTAASAWATQERIDGIKVKGTVTATSEGVTAGSDFEPTTADTTALAEALNTGGFAQNSEAKITFDGGKCTKVEWTDGTDSATYPKK